MFNAYKDAKREANAGDSSILKTSRLLQSVFALFILGNIIIAAIRTAAIKLGGSDPFSDTLTLYCASALIVSVLSMLVPSLIYLHREPFAAPEPRRMNPRTVIISILIGMGGIFLSAALNLLIMIISGGVSASETTIPLPDVSGYRLPVAIIAIALLPAISEELFFRRALLYGYSGLGAFPATILSAVLFALFHANPLGIPVYFALGCIFGFMALKSASPIPPMIAHATNNAAAVLLSAFKAVDAPQPYPQEAMPTLVDPVFCITFMFIAAIILVPCLYAFTRTFKAEETATPPLPGFIQSSAGGMPLAPLANIPFICTALLLITLNALSAAL